MSFGQHFENTILGFVDKVNGMIKRNHEWNEESKALGLVSDEDKLKMMKGELYREVRSSVGDSTKIQRLTDAIQLLEEIRHAEFERKQVELKHRYSFPVQLEVFTNTCILLVIAVIIGSYTASFTCGNSHSMFCGYARSTVYPINKFFEN